MTPDETSTLELRDYLRVLRRRKWIIVVTVLACLGAGVAMTLTRAPVYAASATVLLEARTVDKFLVGQTTSQDDADRQRGNEIQVMSSPKVKAEVQSLLGRVPDEVEFVPVEGTDVVQIVATGENPSRAAETANAYATTYIDVRKQLRVKELNDAAAELQKRINDLTAQITFRDADLAANPPAVDAKGQPLNPSDNRTSIRNQLVAQKTAAETQLSTIQTAVSLAAEGGAQVLAKATVPKDPTNKNPTQNLLAGLAIGLVLGIALAFLREYLDDSVKTKEDLESASGLTVVGIIPALAEWKKREATPLISVMQPRSPAAEAYRSVRTSVEFLSLDRPIGSIQVTSALAAEGKTSTLANLAVTFARAGQRVIILCCDLRRPRVHEFFGLSNRVGFTSVLLGDTPLATAIQQADRELPIGLVASGPLPPNPAELLASKRAVDVVEDLDRRCDLLLIDSPPVLPVTDALVISGLVDGVLLVASGGSSTKRGIKRATELLHQVDAPLIGAILNGVQHKYEYGYAYGDNRYYLEAPPAQARPEPTRRNGKSRARVSVRADR